ncbi:hypothetical protein [Vibrio sp. D431a]|uniref:hypothetical protein n=1 Tax=Vibrio sp. D431a TaxID=2837388 RepID=UPI002557AD56|nr:hypothetical protein [Vibrio sp. D431a]MDK9790034.1 hypothetical protein [Vibrio sp. D431a]
MQNCVEVIQLMSTPLKSECLIKLTKDTDQFKTLTNWKLPLLVTIEGFEYDDTDYKGNAVKSVFENKILIRDSIGNTLYHGSVVEVEANPFDQEESGKYNNNVFNLISAFMDFECSVDERDALTILSSLFPSEVMVDGESTDHDCECCGFFTNSTLELTHTSLLDESGKLASASYFYDGHMGNTFVPNVLCLISFALTGKAQTEFSDY